MLGNQNTQASFIFQRLTPTQNLPRDTFASDTLYLATPAHLIDGYPVKKDVITIFLHIPKCGGTTVHFSISAATQYKQQYYERFIVKDFSPPIMIRDGWNGAWPEALRTIKSLPQNTTFISGHFPFGLDAELPVDAEYITLMRDPVAREVSNYNHHFQKKLIDGNTPLEAYMEKGIFLDNPQTRLLAGVDHMSGACTQETFQLAKENLESRFRLVGIVDDENTFLSAMCAIYDWPPIAYPLSQVSKIKAIQKVSAALEGKIREYHAYDEALYEIAKEMWRSWRTSNLRGTLALSDNDPVILIPPDVHESGRVSLVRAAQLRQTR